MTYKLTIAEDITHRQYVGFIDAENRQEAIHKGKEQFISEHPVYRARFKVITCREVVK